MSLTRDKITVSPFTGAVEKKITIINWTFNFPDCNRVFSHRSNVLQLKSKQIGRSTRVCTTAVEIRQTSVVVVVVLIETVVALILLVKNRTKDALQSKGFIKGIEFVPNVWKYCSLKFAY